MRWDAVSVSGGNHWRGTNDAGPCSGTAKSCWFLAAPTLALRSLRGIYPRAPGVDRWQKSPGHRGRARREKTVKKKTMSRECRLMRCTLGLLTYCDFLLQQAATGQTAHPGIPAPLLFSMGGYFQHLGRNRRKRRIRRWGRGHERPPQKFHLSFPGAGREPISPPETPSVCESRLSRFLHPRTA